LQLEQPVGVDRDRIGLDGGRGGDGAGDDLALGQQALHARIDQAGAELVEVEDADHENDEAGEIEDDDAPGQARKNGTSMNRRRPPNRAIGAGASAAGSGSGSASGASSRSDRRDRLARRLPSNIPVAIGSMMAQALSLKR
jgi:hypothetical protein